MGSGELLFFIGFLFALVGIGGFVWLLVRNLILKHKEESDDGVDEDKGDLP